jgi:hypothetical protein
MANGTTVRANLEQVMKVTGRVPDDLIGPPFPDRYAHIWNAFLELHTGRSYSSNGPNPLSWSDIEAWDRLFKQNLQDWEIRAIKALDLIWLRVMGEDGKND